MLYQQLDHLSWLARLDIWVMAYYMGWPHIRYKIRYKTLESSGKGKGNEKEYIYESQYLFTLIYLSMHRDLDLDLDRRSDGTRIG